MIDTLRHPLTLEVKNKTPDGGGGFIVTWEEAENPDIHADIRQNAAGYLIRIRYRLDVTAENNRLTDGVKNYRIVSVIDASGTKEWLDLTAAEFF